jgi:hypothetical protein
MIVEWRGIKYHHNMFSGKHVLSGLIKKVFDVLEDRHADSSRRLDGQPKISCQSWVK